eukprot:Nitzschia sp. Nitz4//scaffold30_size153850//103225//105773//NITZ4_002786-RA/size153850-augustus-gene-0.73-mRNA-1//-1//CDS//3329547288//6994//frame0
MSTTDKGPKATSTPKTTTTTTTRVIRTTRVVTKSSHQASKKSSTSSGASTEDGFLWFLTLLGVFVATLLLVLLHVLVLAHDHYIRPYLVDVIKWKPELADELYTFEFMNCDSLTATSAEELTILPNHSRLEVFDRLMTHGAGVFPDLADDSLMATVRDYILWRNTRISVSENIPVIGSTRFSFGWDVHEVPVLSEFLQQVSTRNPQLQMTLEGLLGPNPALVELSTITALQGADGQRWHHDLDYIHSAPLLGRSFQHMYSLIIPLQDTTAEMGSTGVAPGTHYCANTIWEDAFPVAGDGVWKAGSGLLYHSAVVHRGGAHVYGPSRVAVILTFTNRPDASHFSDLAAGYSRMLSRGAVYALRYNHWGFTFNDLKDVNATMEIPALSSYGLYKAPEQDWGWTYLRSACFRMMHDQGGFMAMDLEAFVRAKLGIFRYIPSVLLGPVLDLGEEDDYAPWPRFLSETLRNVRTAIFTILTLILATLLGSSALVWLDAGSSDKQRHQARLSFAMIALAVVVPVILGSLMWLRIHKTPFAEAIDTQTAVSLPFPVLADHSLESEYIASLPAADQNDVLVSTRLDHSKLYLQCRWLDYHRPNRRYLKNVIRQMNHAMSYRGMSQGFLLKFWDFVATEGLRHGNSPDVHRILRQNKRGDWVKLSTEEVRQHTVQTWQKLWTLNYAHAEYVGSFWLGPCACGQSKFICSGIQFPKLATDNAVSLWPTERKTVPSVSKATRSPLDRIPPTHLKKTSFKVGDRVEAHVGYLRTRRWFPGVIHHVDVKSRRVAVNFDVPFGVESHRFGEIREIEPLPQVPSLVNPIRTTKVHEIN